MSEDPPSYAGFRETTLADQSLREIASRIGGALMDLTGQICEFQITALDRRPDGVYPPEARDAGIRAFLSTRDVGAGSVRAELAKCCLQ